MMASAFLDGLAFANHRSGHVGIVVVVISELKYSDVKHQVIFGAHFVERATTLRLKMLQKPSIVFMCTAPTTY
jgi:hypothetical protein